MAAQDFLRGNPVGARVLRGGTWANSIIDYVYGRPKDNPLFDRMSWYDWIRLYRIVPKSKLKSKSNAKSKSIDLEADTGSDDDENDAGDEKASVSASAGAESISNRGRPGRTH